MFATAAARALVDVDGMDAATVGRKAMNIAADMCVYTNKNFVELSLDAAPKADADADADASK